MGFWRSHAQEQIELLRALVKYFEATAENSRDVELHARLLAEMRNQLAELEMSEAARARRFAPLQKLLGFGVGNRD